MFSLRQFAQVYTHSEAAVKRAPAAAGGGGAGECAPSVTLHKCTLTLKQPVSSWLVKPSPPKTKTKLDICFLKCSRAGIRMQKSIAFATTAGVSFHCLLLTHSDIASGSITCTASASSATLYALLSVGREKYGSFRYGEMELMYPASVLHSIVGLPPKHRKDYLLHHHRRKHWSAPVAATSMKKTLWLPAQTKLITFALPNVFRHMLSHRCT